MNALPLRRIIIFTARMAEMVRFYDEVIGLDLVAREDGWVEFRAGGCSLALHEWHGEAAEGPIKIVFHADDVRSARDELLSRGALMGEIVTYRDIDLCDGKDPDGNAFQLSSRHTP